MQKRYYTACPREKHPGLVIFMIDQSCGLKESSSFDGKTLADLAADFLNCSIEELIHMNIRPMLEDEDDEDEDNLLDNTLVFEEGTITQLFSSVSSNFKDVSYYLTDDFMSQSHMKKLLLNVNDRYDLHFLSRLIRGPLHFAIKKNR